MRRAFAVLAMLALLVSGQVLALMHRVVHAQDASQKQEQSYAPLHQKTCLPLADKTCSSADQYPAGNALADETWFGHDRGTGCLEFDAALGSCAPLPVAAQVHAEPAPNTILHLAEIPAAPAPLRGFALARAPPRA